MPAPDYAKTTNEKLWVSDEATFNTMAQPLVTDAVIPLPGVNIPPALREYTRSRERTGSPSIYQLIPRKRRPSAWSLPLYLKAANAPGTVPSYGLLLKKAFGVETIVGGTSVTYALATAIEETSFSLWHFLDNLLFGHRGCLANRVTLELSGSDEGKVTVDGFGADTVFAGVTTLNGGIDAVVSSIVVTDSRVFQVGPVSATDRVRFKIDSEAFEIISINYSTHTLTVATRGTIAGTAAAVHSNGAELTPYTPGADTDPADTIMPMTLGSIVLGTVTVIPRTFRQIIDNGLDPRLDEYAQDAATGYRRSANDAKRTVTGSLSGYAKKAHQSLLSDLDRELVEAATIIAGAATASMARLTITMTRLRLSNLRVMGDGPEFAFEFDYEALASAPGANDETSWVFD